MSHDFRTAGRRALTAISDLGRLCSSASPSCDPDDQVESEGKISKAIEEADAQHDNAVDKSAVELLVEYNRSALDAVLDRGESALNIPHPAWCNAGRCQAMYATCKQEAEQAFETGILPQNQNVNRFQHETEVRCSGYQP